MVAVRKSHRSYHYETTVGAGLPVIETLKNLIRTGDHVRRIEGFFSGSLAYIIGQLSAGVKLSEAVKAAHAQGYTEPSPQDDLGGMDVARKALILARELGMEVELEDIDLEPFVPKDYLQPCGVEELVGRIRKLNDDYARRVEAAREKGKILSYLACIERGNGKPRIRVGLDEVGAASPSATAKGSAFVAFYTERYGEEPLLVQGAGAGGGVTAAGVLADILRVSLELRGR
jgi:aspartokinase/homoserine dehydrogenase 1